MTILILIAQAIRQMLCRHDFVVVLDHKDREMNRRSITSFCPKCGKWSSAVTECEGQVVL